MPTKDADREGMPSFLGTQLPLWSEKSRGVSNITVRSAMFRVGHPSTPRRQMKREHIPSTANYIITYTGEELRQDDEDVWLQITHLARRLPLGEPVHFTAHAVLSKTGRSVNSANYTRLRETLERMTASAVTTATSDGKMGFSGSLIRSFSWSSQDGLPRPHWEVDLDPKILVLYGGEGWSAIDWNLRMSLSPLGKWLHSFYSTHDRPFDYSAVKLHELCGSSSTEPRKFRYKLQQTLDLLVDKGFLLSAKIDRGGMVEVVRNPRTSLLLHA